MLGYCGYSAYFGLDVQFLGLDVHFDVQAGKCTSKLGSGIPRNIKDIKKVGDMSGIGYIGNNTRCEGIRNI